MTNQNIALMAHLMRRAGFSVDRPTLENYVAKGYEETVEELLYPENPDNIPDDIIRRFHVDQSELRIEPIGAAYWLYRIITSTNFLEEKIALFFHGLFATSYSKINHTKTQLDQIDTFRRHGLGSFPNLLVELSKDPAMIVWLDNNDNHKGAINENYGRELLELFSMGIGNYSEKDVKECARAFTGWTLGNAEYMAVRTVKDSPWPYGEINWHFQYRPEDHDDGEKTFLGETGNFNGEGVIEIIARQPATAEFICTRLFQFFGADKIDKNGAKVVAAMKTSYFDSGYEIRSVLRTLFNSEYFKSEQARSARVKGPVELVAGAIRLAGSYRSPTYGIHKVAQNCLFMGQGLLSPPTVEGWHEADEWIDSGALVERINFVASELGNVSNPGVRTIINRLSNQTSSALSPEDVVDTCLDMMGPISASQKTYKALVEHVSEKGSLNLKQHSQKDESEQRVGEVLGLIASSPEFQLA